MSKFTKDWVLERFFNKVLIAPFNECWIWLGATSAGASGFKYGCFWTGTKRMLAHRFSFEQFDRKLMSGERVLHRCDNPLCVNPAHLKAGTNADNVKDKISKGRQARGEKMNRGKTTSDDVLELRRMHAAGLSQSAIGRLFKLSSGTISKIINKELWKHI